MSSRFVRSRFLRPQRRGCSVTDGADEAVHRGARQRLSGPRAPRSPRRANWSSTIVPGALQPAREASDPGGGADRLDDSRALVAEHRGQRQRHAARLRCEVGVADPAAADADEHLIAGRFGKLDLFQRQRAVGQHRPVELEVFALGRNGKRASEHASLRLFRFVDVLTGRVFAEYRAARAGRRAATHVAGPRSTRSCPVTRSTRRRPSARRTTRWPWWTPRSARCGCASAAAWLARPASRWNCRPRRCPWAAAASHRP
jgi:hypothetical protein